MNELAVRPQSSIDADRKFAVAEHRLRPFGIVAQMRDDFVVLIEQRHARVQIGDQQHITANVEVSRETHRRVQRGDLRRQTWLTLFVLRDKSDVLAIECQVLQSRIRSIGHDQRRLTARPVIEPLTMRRLELPRFGTVAAKRPHPLGVFVVLMNPMRAVSVTDVEAAVGCERNVRRAVWRLRIVVLAGFEQPLFLPDDLPLQCGLRDEIRSRRAEIEKFFAPLFANVDAVPAGVIFLAERTDEFPVGVEDDNRIQRLRCVRAMRDVDQPGLVDGNSVRLAPLNVIGSLAPIV